MLADVLKDRRKMRGWSQKHVALTVGCSQPEVSAWESGAKMPDVDKLFRLSLLLGFSLDRLALEVMDEQTKAN